MKVRLYKDGKRIDGARSWAWANLYLRGGGMLIICQRSTPEGRFQPNTPCYGEIGAVEIWDHYIDSKYIHCVSNCWSVGNLYHLDWNKMKRMGTVIKHVGNLGSLVKTDDICEGEFK